MKDIVVSLHSIIEVLKNPHRTGFQLYSTDEAWKTLKNKSAIPKERLNQLEIKLLNQHQIQEEGKKRFDAYGFKYSRIPSGIFLEVDPMEVKSIEWLFEKIKEVEQIKIFVLDQVTDIHNAAAIMRTASFYGVDALLISSKSSFNITPGFYRNSSGATEHVPLVRCTNLSRTIVRFQELDVQCLGMTEHAQSSQNPIGPSNKRAIVMGSEEKGLSHAVTRIIQHKVALQGSGAIKTLNVSVASAISMEKFFS